MTPPLSSLGATLTTEPVRPTPAGAYRAVAHPQPDEVARLLLAVLRQPTTPVLSIDALRIWTGAQSDSETVDVLRRAQSDSLLETVDGERTIPSGPLESLIPQLLTTLSDTGDVLVADPDGLPVWSQGFDLEVATRVAAMSGDLASLHERHVDTIVDLFGDAASAWALVDGIGASRIGCWPLHIGGTRFVLVARGLPRLHHPNFTMLVWLLVHRYG